MTTSAETLKSVSPYHLPITSCAQTCTDVTPHRRQGWDIQKRKVFCDCELISFVFTSCRAQPHAKLSQAERSEALPREARPPPKAAGAEGAPELREGFKQKHGCDLTACDFARGVYTAWVGGKACSARMGFLEDVYDFHVP